MNSRSIKAGKRSTRIYVEALKLSDKYPNAPFSACLSWAQVTVDGVYEPKPYNLGGTYAYTFSTGGSGDFGLSGYYEKMFFAPFDPVEPEPPETRLVKESDIPGEKSSWAKVKEGIAHWLRL